MSTRISGHTGAKGGSMDAHTEPSSAVPGQYEGPIDGRLGDYDASMDGRPDDDLARRSTHARMTPATNGNGRAEGRSIAELLRELSTESGDLVRQEMELAKAEMREKMAIFTRGMVSMGIGGALLLCALLTGLWAVNSGLTSLLAQFLDLEIAVWLSPLILTIALAVGGWMMIQGAKQRMADEGIAMRRTTATLKEDKRWAQARAHEVKEEVTHGR